MDEPERDPLLAQAVRHVREGEMRVARQRMLVKSLAAAGRHEEARIARMVLDTLTDTLDAARRHLQRKQREQGAKQPKERAFNPG
ncbi:MAG: hypothetical protein JO166_05580 [Deltaproteobacteria bacterium]|nr:hypothetical protein [Deltaproteobacteria bacterium]